MHEETLYNYIRRTPLDDDEIMKTRKKTKERILNSVLIIITILIIIFCSGIGILVASFFGVITDYTYLKINDKNRDEITSLIKQQESKMFSMSKDLDIDKCTKDVKRLEVVFLFPDGEDYTIYCNNNKYKFSLDDANYDLPTYMTKYGKSGFKIRF